MCLGRFVRCVKKTSAVVMMAAMSFVVAARGEVLCLCDDDPDDCGRKCHECGHAKPDGLVVDDDCFHLEIDTGDIATADDGVRLPDVGAAPIPRALLESAVLTKRDSIAYETSPPFRLATYCSYSVRLFPRS